ncbi:MAG TPA: glycosyltransferase, partial [Sedimentisphaerales bacterium]|nr:glycosyltransferase [Sedimentisphaerales bacterium]
MPKSMAEAYAYSSMLAELNGRFAPVARPKGASIDRAASSHMGTKSLIVLAVAALGFGVWANWHEMNLAMDILRRCLLGAIYTGIGQACLFICISALAWQVMLASRYRPSPTCSDEQLPMCTVVVPAYNEGRMVLRTLRSIARSDYPAEKLQIIAVDDGSTDDTWQWIQKAGREFAGIVTIRQPHNAGKKQAMYDAFHQATGDVLVTVDSDSLIEPETLRRLVSPLCHNSRVGAVAGNVRVLNRHEGLIPRMLEVAFAFSFEFIRSAQSSVRTVFCTPGALAAYRRSAIMPVLDSWLNQTFFGQPAKIGEDRAITNWILRTGHEVVFQSNAIVYTNVPSRYDDLCKMFLRWARSNVRENIMMGRYIFRRFRPSSVAGARAWFILSVFSLLAPHVLLAGATVCLLWKPGVFFMPMMLGSALCASVIAGFYAYRHRSSDALWAYAYSFFWTAGLFWISGYALLTAHNNSWMARDQKTPSMKIPASS